MKIIKELREKSQELFTKTKDPKFKLISEILKDDNCFFNIEYDVAIDILNSLGIAEKEVYYKKLTSYEAFQENKIQIID